MNGLVLANSLTQVMWGFALAVWFGNLIIAVIEGGLIASVFRVNAFRAVGLMIVANLTSAWTARFVFGLGEEPTPLVEWFFDEPLYQVQVIVWVCIAVGIAMTLALEWPFVWLALGGTRDRLVRSLKAILLVHAVSITCLCGWFWPPSSNTLGREVTVVRNLKVDPALLQGWVYYVHRRSGDVHRIRLDGSRDELVMRAGADPHRAIMWIEALPWIEDLEFYELRLVETRSLESSEKVVEVFDALTRVRVFQSLTEHSKEAGGASPEWTLSFGMATADFRDDSNRAWQAFARYNEGLRINTGDADSPMRLSFNTPFDTWRTHCVTALPGDLAVFDFGLQTCFLNVRTREVTLLAHGVGPVVVLDPSPESATP